ncbi:MAG: hypothetical protein ACTS5P_01545 [Candidatus Hodgkinia cicadicola]
MRGWGVSRETPLNGLEGRSTPSAGLGRPKASSWLNPAEGIDERSQSSSPSINLRPLTMVKPKLWPQVRWGTFASRRLNVLIFTLNEVFASSAHWDGLMAWSSRK